MATATIIDKSYKVSTIYATDFYNGKIVEGKRSVKVDQRLPFYVRLENVQIAAWGPSNPAPIGIAIIGVSNYLL